MNNLLIKYNDNVTLLSPYTNSYNIFTDADAIISIPYTSTKFFADKHNKPSIFYYPESVQHLYDYGNYDKSLVFGKKNLKNFLLNI